MINFKSFYFLLFPGPWIENLFISHFIGKPFSSFNGIVPIFVQWSDYHLNYRASITSEREREKTEAELYSRFLSKIRKNVLYVVISQANYGLSFLRKFSNILIFSAGGEGEVPIPLIKGELPFVEVDWSLYPKYDVSFLGSIDHGHRKKVLDNLIRLLDNSKAHTEEKYNYLMGPSKTWEEEMYVDVNVREYSLLWEIKVMIIKCPGKLIEGFLFLNKSHSIPCRCICCSFLFLLFQGVNTF